MFIISIIWFDFRIILAKSDDFSFDFHKTHHYDLGFIIVILSMHYTLGILGGVGIIIMLDDIIGHARKNEEFVLEPLFRLLLNPFFKWIDK